MATHAQCEGRGGAHLSSAKTNCNVLQDGPGPDDKVPKAVAEFVRECQLMSTLRHQNIIRDAPDTNIQLRNRKLFAHAHVSHGSVRS